MNQFFSELKNFPKKCDWVLLLLCLVTSGFGMICLASATSADKFGGNLRYMLVQGAGIVLGVIMYFFQTPKRQIWVFAAFCVLCLAGTGLRILFPAVDALPFAATYFSSLQCWMVLTIPLMCQYNGQPGKSLKGFFYAYYPLLHCSY